MVKFSIYLNRRVFVMVLFFFVLFFFFNLKPLIFVRSSTEASKTGTVAHLLKDPLYDREVVDWIPGRVIPKTLKMVQVALA